MDRFHISLGKTCESMPFDQKPEIRNWAKKMPGTKAGQVVSHLTSRLRGGSAARAIRAVR